MSKNTKELRILTFISVIFVVWLHVYNYSSLWLYSWKSLNQNPSLNSIIQFFISNGLARFAVPMLFMISGERFFFQFDPSFNNYLKKLKSRLATLVLPYFFWSMVGIFIDEMKSSADHSLFLPWQYNGYNIHLWYVRTLIFYILLAPFWSQFFKTKLMTSLLLMTFTLAYIFNPFLSIDGLIGGGLFFLLGGQSHFSLFKFIQSCSRSQRYLSLLVWIFVVALRMRLEIENIYLAKTIFLLMNVLGIFAVIQMVREFGHFKVSWIERLSASSALIYFAHLPLLGVARFYFSMDSMSSYFFCPIFVIVLLVLMNRFLKKMPPHMRLLLTGGRS